MWVCLNRSLLFLKKPEYKNKSFFFGRKECGWSKIGVFFIFKKVFLETFVVRRVFSIKNQFSFLKCFFKSFFQWGFFSFPTFFLMVNQMIFLKLFFCFCQRVFFSRRSFFEFF